MYFPLVAFQVHALLTLNKFRTEVENPNQKAAIDVYEEDDV